MGTWRCSASSVVASSWGRGPRASLLRRDTIASVQTAQDRRRGGSAPMGIMGESGQCLREAGSSPVCPRVLDRGYAEFLKIHLLRGWVNKGRKRAAASMPLVALVLPSSCSVAFALPRAYGAAVFPLPCFVGNPPGGGGEGWLAR